MADGFWTCATCGFDKCWADKTYCIRCEQAKRAAAASGSSTAAPWRNAGKGGRGSATAPTKGGGKGKGKGKGKGVGDADGSANRGAANALAVPPEPPASAAENDGAQGETPAEPGQQAALAQLEARHKAAVLLEQDTLVQQFAEKIAEKRREIAMENAAKRSPHAAQCNAYKKLQAAKKARDKHDAATKELQAELQTLQAKVAEAQATAKQKNDRVTELEATYKSTLLQRPAAMSAAALLARMGAVLQSIDAVRKDIPTESGKKLEGHFDCINVWLGQMAASSLDSLPGGGGGGAAMDIDGPEAKGPDGEETLQDKLRAVCPEKLDDDFAFPEGAGDWKRDDVCKRVLEATDAARNKKQKV